MSNSSQSPIDLADHKQKVDGWLDDFFAKNELVESMYPQLGVSKRFLIEANEHLAEYCSRGGKRMRAILAEQGYRSFGGQNESVIRDMAVAMEIAQSYLLMIDDVMDRSDTRRFKPSLHMLYRDQIADSSRPDLDIDHEANSLAANTGLISQHLCSMLISRIDEQHDRVLKASEIFHRNMVLTCSGQMQDIYNNSRSAFNEHEIIQLHALKSGYYTIANPIQIGMALAGADPILFETIDRIGASLGVVYQLYDDYVGLFGDSRNTGKPNTSDLSEGKMTLLMYKTLEMASDSDQKIVRSILGSNEISSQDHDKVIDIVRECGALEAVLAVKYQHAKQASELIDESDLLDQLKSACRAIIGISKIDGHD